MALTREPNDDDCPALDQIPVPISMNDTANNNHHLLISNLNKQARTNFTLFLLSKQQTFSEQGQLNGLTRLNVDPKALGHERDLWCGMHLAKKKGFTDCFAN